MMDGVLIICISAPQCPALPCAGKHGGLITEFMAIAATESGPARDHLRDLLS